MFTSHPFFMNKDSSLEKTNITAKARQTPSQCPKDFN